MKMMNILRTPSQLYRCSINSESEGSTICNELIKGPEFIIRSKNVPVKIDLCIQLKNKNSSKTFTIVTLDGQHLEINCHPASTCIQQILEALMENAVPCYPGMGLAFLHKGEFIFTKGKTKIMSIAPRGWKCSSLHQREILLENFTLYLRFATYPLKNNFLNFMIRDSLYLQLRQDIIEGRFIAPSYVLFRLAALAIKIEFKDRIDENNPLFLLEHYLPEHLTTSNVNVNFNLLKYSSNIKSGTSSENLKICGKNSGNEKEAHSKEAIGCDRTFTAILSIYNSLHCSTDIAKRDYVNFARGQMFYGTHTFLIKDEKRKYFCINHCGVTIYDKSPLSGNLPTRFSEYLSWSEVKRLSSRKGRLTISLSGGKSKRKFEFDKRRCRHILNHCKLYKKMMENEEIPEHLCEAEKDEQKVQSRRTIVANLFKNPLYFSPQPQQNRIFCKRNVSLRDLSKETEPKCRPKVVKRHSICGYREMFKLKSPNADSNNLTENSTGQDYIQEIIEKSSSLSTNDCKSIGECYITNLSRDFLDNGQKRPVDRIQENNEDISPVVNNTNLSKVNHEWTLLEGSKIVEKNSHMNSSVADESNIGHTQQSNFSDNIQLKEINSSQIGDKDISIEKRDTASAPTTLDIHQIPPSLIENWANKFNINSPERTLSLREVSQRDEIYYSPKKSSIGVRMGTRVSAALLQKRVSEGRSPNSSRELFTSPRVIEPSPFVKCNLSETVNETLLNRFQNISPCTSPSLVERRLENISLKKDNGSLGLQVAQASDGNIYITGITEGGEADLKGIKVGDRLLGVDGLSVENLPYEYALSMLKSSKEILSLLVSQPVAISQISKISETSQTTTVPDQVCRRSELVEPNINPIHITVIEVEGNSNKTSQVVHSTNEII